MIYKLFNPFIHLNQITRFHTHKTHKQHTQTCPNLFFVTHPTYYRRLVLFCTASRHGSVCLCVCSSVPAASTTTFLTQFGCTAATLVYTIPGKGSIVVPGTADYLVYFRTFSKSDCIVMEIGKFSV